MEYKVITIASREELERCTVFRVDQFAGRCTKRPETFGRMGYQPGTGFWVQMECRQKDPLCRYTQFMDPVCRDDAMEAFFWLTGPKGLRAPKPQPGDAELYFNYEVNSAGALYAKGGFGRAGRVPLTPQQVEASRLRVEKEPDAWRLELLLPLSATAPLSGVEEYHPGDAIFCNFYKIAQEPAIEHYASFSPVQSDPPQFHDLSCFARAVLV